MGKTTPDDAAKRRVQDKLSRSDERLERRYSASSPNARRNVDARAQFLKNRALSTRNPDGTITPRMAS